MASKPGILTDWPWKPLGSFKYLILAPWVLHSIYSFVTKDGKERSLAYLLIFPSQLWRMLHNQIWISFSRYRTANGKNRIVDKSIEFEQVDRESNWSLRNSLSDDQILWNGILFYVAYFTLSGVPHMPLWRTDGVILTILLHMGPVEFLYYWLHRALHQHYLYLHYHSHHHSSIVTEPISSVIHPFAEHLGYFLLFSIPMLTIILVGKSSIVAIVSYISYIDFMNNMGHCNFEMIPKMVFSAFPLLKYLMYTPSYHSLHHTRIRTNYSLFMPIYDYIFGTMDKSSDALYEKSLKRPAEIPNVVHLTHLVTPESIYYLRLGFTSLASKPYASKWYILMVMWPVTYFSIMFMTWIYHRTYILERNQFKKFNIQTWVVPKFKKQYLSKSRYESINRLIEEAILKADESGVKVLSLGLLNQGDELNSYGELYILRNPKLKTKVVDGSSLAVAVVLNSIPKGTTQVLLRGNLSKFAYFVSSALCQMGIQVATSQKDEYDQLKAKIKNINEYGSKLVLSKRYDEKVWLVGDGLTKEEQLKAPKGTLFIPFSQFPPKKMRKDCFYHTTPAMMSPKSFQNIDSCENWLPRRVMSASRVAGAIHALEGWNVHECGNTMFEVEKIWEATLCHGFRPLPILT